MKDRLPEFGERVLFSDGAFVGEGYINQRGKWMRYNGKISAICLDVFDVAHWMPLPEPPEVETEDKENNFYLQRFCRLE